MDPDNLPSNNRSVNVRRSASAETRIVTEQSAQKEPSKPVVKQIVSGTVERRKRSIGTKLKNFIVGGETQGVFGFLVEHVIKPAAQDMVADAVREGVDRMVYGENRPSVGRSRPGGSGSFTNYGNFANRSNTTIRRSPDPRGEAPAPTFSRQGRRTHDFGEIVLGTRAEAMEILTALDTHILKYDSGSVADLLKMLGITPEWTDEKWGWDNIDKASVRHTRDGYLLDLPPTIPLG